LINLKTVGATFGIGGAIVPPLATRLHQLYKRLTSTKHRQSREI